jgi:predicted 3-demethylubiquinone-9 3-methyltransferase (glyoxalase superfamily)
MQKIIPFLWFNDKAEEAANFYVSIFKNSKILNLARYREGGPGPKGTVMVATFQIEGQKNHGAERRPALHIFSSHIVLRRLRNPGRVDELWEKLSAEGSEVQCGWLKDKFGVSWQIIPKTLIELMQDKAPVKSRRVFKAMMQMIKIDIEGLTRANRGE